MNLACLMFEKLLLQLVACLKIDQCLPIIAKTGDVLLSSVRKDNTITLTQEHPIHKLQTRLHVCVSTQNKILSERKFALNYIKHYKRFDVNQALQKIKLSKEIMYGKD